MNKVIVTIGPKSIYPEVLKSLIEAGANSFRINLSHSNPTSLEQYFYAIESSGVIPSIDTQGAQLRVEKLLDKSEFMKGEILEIIFGSSSYDKNINLSSSDYPCIVLNHPEASDQVFIGDLLKIDFNGLTVSLSERVSKYIWRAEVVGSGSVVNNRAVDVSGRTINLAPLTNFDIEAIKIAQAKGCKEVYASFVSSKSDVLLIRNELMKDTVLVSKIETALGVANAGDIIEYSDAILIDRGDLSREISIPSVPIAVNSIIRLAKERQKPVYVATNVLDSMMSSSLPSRAEISDIFTLLNSGVSGLVLAAEVAIGNNPVASTSLLSYLMRLYDCHSQGLFGVGSVLKPSKQLIGDELYNWI